MSVMLTKQDLKEIVNIINETVPAIINATVPNIVRKIINETVPQIVENIVEPKFEEFAIMMKNRFDEVDEKFEEIEEKIDQKADKNDILRLENRFENRLCLTEDNIRIVKTKLKIS